MFKIILFMHGKLAEEFIRASALVFGDGGLRPGTWL